MIDKNIVICLLARDCSSAVLRNIPKIEQLRTFFSNSSVVAVENDSKDNTKEVLKEWRKKSDNIHLVLNDFGTLTIASSEDKEMRSYNRIEKMARYRNMYMEYVEKNILHSVDYVIVIDIDIYHFDVDGVLKTIEVAPEDWGGLFANGTQRLSLWGKVISRRQYDLFAFLKDEGAVINPKTMFEWKRKIDKKIENAIFLKCVSAFGGMGIYKWEAIKGLRYVAEENPNIKGEYIAEHISFHRDIIKKGFSNYISKKMKVDYGEGPLKMFVRTLFP